MTGESVRPRAANPARGEAGLTIGNRRYIIRPTFAALVAAEEELGPLFALLARAGDGQLRLSEMAALIWHCLDKPSDSRTRDDLNNTLIHEGLAQVTPAIRVILRQILIGRGDGLSDDQKDGETDGYQNGRNLGPGQGDKHL